MKDFYYILGLNQGSSPDEIKEAYRKLSKKLHPDLNQGDEYFENRFKDIQEAFEILRDPAKRARYDEQLNRFNTESEIKKQQAYERAYRQPPPRPAPRAYRASSTKTMHRNRTIGLDITIAAVGTIVAFYLYSMFISPPKTRVVHGEIAPAAAVMNHPKHKHRHFLRNKFASDSNELVSKEQRPAHIKPQVAKAPATKQPAPSPEVVKAPLLVESRAAPAAIKPVPKPDTAVKPVHKNDFLYSTYVHPNVTGIVPMRAYNTYSANIIASIPGHTKVLVLERGDTYYRVCYDKTIGFVPKWSLEEK
jgi:curved DNA-binding protein CbpA